MSTVNETLESLNLSANPFAADTPIASLYPGALRRDTLEKLLHHATHSNDIIALLGPAGSGKSLIGDFFVRQAAKRQLVARARASLLTSPAQLLEEMFKAFVLDFPPHATLADLKSALLDYFESVRQQSRSVVLIVDDAHELGDDALALLTRLALVDNVEGTFHLILLGQPQLLDTLDYTCPMHNGAQQFSTIQLEALSLDETHDYLRYRLNAVGFAQGDQARPLPFSNKQIEKIHKQSGGMPGAINVLADSMLSAPQGKGLALDLSFISSIPRNYALAAVALLVVLFVAFLSGGDDEVEETSRTVSVPVQLPGLQNQTATAIPQTNAQLADSLATNLAANSPSVAAPVVTNPVATAPAATTPAAVVSSQPSTDPVAVAAPARPVIERNAATSAAATTTAVAQPTPAAPTPVAAAPVTAAATTPVPTAAPTGAGQQTQILALPANQFTLQVLGASSRTNVEQFVQRHTASGLRWYETRNNGSPWFVVIQGAYASRESAREALADLPAELRDQQPWVRSLEEVHTEIRARN
ncbi:MAG: AAA family ATPase [Pseudomonadota bacterium]